MAKSYKPQFFKLSTLSWLTILFVLIYSATLFYKNLYSHPQDLKTFGTRDFIEYWSAYKLYQNKQNPYDRVEMLKIQQEIERELEVPLMMWNPPWLLEMFSPILQLPFQEAALAWFILNTLFCLLIAFILWSVYSKNNGSIVIPGVISTFSFFPIIFNFEFGQMGVVLALGVSILLWSLHHKKYWASGLGLLLMSLKPHIAYLLLFVLLQWTLRKKKYQILYSTLFFLSVFIIAVTLRLPSAIKLWLVALSNDNSILIWKVGTLVGWLRYILSDYSSITLWPTTIIPIACLIVAYYILLRRGTVKDWANTTPLVLGISVITSPYGWCFDQSVLVILQVSAIYYLLHTAELAYQILLIGLLYLLQAVALWFRHEYATSHEQFFLLPVIQLLLWLIITSLKRYRGQTATG